ncbi:S1 RNA-binding domain-containing protein [Streptomyces sp. PB17]|uniref:S1 RNA-binding domain-containing protein n=1 Tax=Streptomyces sp. PB17 TaxID=3384158 RepID=UPI0038B5889C
MLSVELEKGAGHPVCPGVGSLTYPELSWRRFEEAAEDVEGLVHLPELSSDPGMSPEDVVQTGQELAVVVTGVDRERRRLFLSLRAAT